jgi:hypothetical protein
MFRHL